MKSMLLLLNTNAVKNIICFLLVCLLTFPSNAQDKIRILPLGNSITAGWKWNKVYDSEGNEDVDASYESTVFEYSYRDELIDLLGTDRYEFVGSQQNEANNLNSRHEGHPGWEARHILNGNYTPSTFEWVPGKLENWINGGAVTMTIDKIPYPANYDGFDYDYVLLHIGTNDVNGMANESTYTVDGETVPYTVERTMDNISSIINKLLEKYEGQNHEVKIFLAKIIPNQYKNANTYVNLLNSSLETLASESDNIILVDHYTPLLNNYLPNTLLFQESTTKATVKCHPNRAGAVVMARTWYHAIKSYEFAGIGGARAMYFNDGSDGHITELIHPVIINREEAQIDFNWTNGTPDVKIGALESDAVDNFSARYEGTIIVDYRGSYKFQVSGATGDKFRFWLNGTLYIDNWDGTGNTSSDYIPLSKTDPWSETESEKGHPFRLEYKHRGVDNAQLSLQWQKAGVNSNSWTPVPAINIGPPLETQAHGTGLQGSYYANVDMSGTPIVRNDQQINFSWDKFNPDSRMNNTNETYAVVWEGKVQPLYDGDYYFWTRYDKNVSSMEFYLNTTKQSPVVTGGQKYRIDGLRKGTKYDLKIIYKKTSSGLSDNIMLEWESVNKTPQFFQIVPPYCLFLPDGSNQITTSPYPNGLTATYYNIKSDYIQLHKDEDNWEQGLLDFIKSDPDDLAIALDVENKVVDHANFLKFNWWGGSPDYQIGADYFVVIWRGSIALIEPHYSGPYAFKWSADNIGYLKLGSTGTPSYLELSSTYPNVATKGVPLYEGEQYPIEAIVIERGGWASTQTVLEWIDMSDPHHYGDALQEYSLLKSNELVSSDDTAEYETVPPEVFIAPNIENAQIKLLVFGEDRSSTVDKLKSNGYDVRTTSNVDFFSDSEFSDYDQIWVVDYKKVPDSQGTEKLKDYIINGGKVFFAGENFNNVSSSNATWRDSLLNALGAGGIKQSETVNPTKIGFYYANPDHIISQSPFVVDSIKHLSEGNGTFENPGNGTVIAGTEPGGQGNPVAVAFDYGKLGLAPDSKVIVYLNSNNGENWAKYAANIAEYFKQDKSENILTVHDSQGTPGSSGFVTVGLENTDSIAGLQFTLTDNPELLTATAVNTTSRTSGFTVGFNEGESGAVTVILYSPTGNVIPPGDGAIVEMIYNVSSGAVAGESSQLQLSNVILSNSEGMSIPVISQNGIFRFISSKGDVNGDGVVDIFDVIRAVNIILGIAPEPTGNELYAADFNSDENVDVLDVIQIVNYILDNPQQNQLLVTKSQGANTIWVDNAGFESGQNMDIPVMANLSEEVAGMQLRLNYNPQHLNLGEPVTANRSSGLNVASRISGGELIVLMYSLDGKTIQPGEGPVLHVPAIASADGQGTSGLTLKEVTLVDPLARPISVGIITGNKAELNIATDFVLYQNYPNPFYSETLIEYSLPRSANISIKIHNSLGQLVQELVSAKKQAGSYNISWNGTNSEGLTVPPGIYFYQLNADDDFISRKKMVVMK